MLLDPPFLSTPTFIVNSRIQSESSTGSVDSQRIRLTLSISVDNVDFDTQVGMLRISGRVIVENPHVKVLPQPLPTLNLFESPRGKTSLFIFLDPSFPEDTNDVILLSNSWEHSIRSTWR